MTEELKKLLDDIAKLPEMRKRCEEGCVIEFMWNPEMKWVELWYCLPTEEARERDRKRLKERAANQ